GVLWQLPLRQTVVLVLATGYIIGKSIMFARRSDPLDACFFASLTLAAVIWTTSAFVNSDIAHILAAFTPMIVVLALLAPREIRSRPALAAWVVTVCGVLFVWPSFNFSAPVDIYHVVRRDIRVETAIRNIYAPKKPLEANLSPKLQSPGSDPRDVSV